MGVGVVESVGFLGVIYGIFLFILPLVIVFQLRHLHHIRRDQLDVATQIMKRLDKRE